MRTCRSEAGPKLDCGTHSPALITVLLLRHPGSTQGAIGRAAGGDMCIT